MLRADPKRIAWFLSLRRILQFPKHFMAPQTIFKSGHGLVESAVEPTGTSDPSPRRESPTPIRPRGLPASSLPILNRATSPIDNSGLAGILRVIGETASISTSHFLPWRTAPISTHIPKPEITSEKLSGRQAVVGFAYWSPQESNRPIGAPDNSRFQSNKSSALAPISASPSGQSLGDIRRLSDPSLLVAGTDEVTSGYRPELGSNPSPLDQIYENQSDLPSSGQDGTTRSTQPQHSRPASSTLHIDGSALGRWVVQHLERALGKPATGMTGVDPRATKPRSRVAPF